MDKSQLISSCLLSAPFLLVFASSHSTTAKIVVFIYGALVSFGAIRMYRESEKQ